MAGIKAIFMTFSLIAAQLLHVYSSPATVPAFLWSRFHHGQSQDSNKEGVNYQTISPKNLAKVILTDGGWSSFVCSGQSLDQNVDVALVFIGKELQTSDISRSSHLHPSTLIDLLKQSFKSSNASTAFPYISLSIEKDTLENSLILGFFENCNHNLQAKRIVLTKSCSLDGRNFKRLEGLPSLQDYINTKTESGADESTDLIVFCAANSEELTHTESEGNILSEIIDLLEKSVSAYTVLYASDPYRTYPSLSHSAMRVLAEENNLSSNSTLCNGLCELKASLFEGLFVGIVLLIILISGLCCMMGIDTPTRFETSTQS